MPSIRVRPETGLLLLDFTWRGHRFREQTALTDTPASRKRLQKVLDRIVAEIAAGTFDYGAPLASRCKAVAMSTRRRQPLRQSRSRPPLLSLPRPGFANPRWAGGAATSSPSAACSTNTCCRTSGKRRSGGGRLFCHAAFLVMYFEQSRAAKGNQGVRRRNRSSILNRGTAKREADG